MQVEAKGNQRLKQQQGVRVRDQKSKEQPNYGRVKNKFWNLDGKYKQPRISNFASPSSVMFFGYLLRTVFMILTPDPVVLSVLLLPLRGSMEPLLEASHTSGF